MRARISANVRRRAEAFGGTIYVHSRNDFFFLDRVAFALTTKLGASWTSILDSEVQKYKNLAKLGICETAEPTTKQVGYSGTAFIGAFDDIPKVRDPLVVNCFATSHCPLVCKYCHADDLMQGFREDETEEQIDKVVESIKNVAAVTAVVTGGDPFTRLSRTRRLLSGVGKSKALVLDTSGVLQNRGDLDIIIPELLNSDVHVRVSVDDFDDTNSRTRPINRRYIRDGLSSYKHAEQSIKRFLEANISVTVQTVLSRFNDNPQGLYDFARVLAAWGVRNWVIHITVLAGKAGVFERTRSARTQIVRCNRFLDHGMV